MDLPALPQDLPAWAFVTVSIVVVIGIVLVAYLTGNHKNNSKVFKDISQKGSNNKQQIGSYLDEKEEDN